MVNNLITTYQAYPSAIRPHLLKADTNLFLRDLFTKSGMRILIDILGRTPIHDKSLPIHFRVDRVAASIGISEKTVQRVLSVLMTNKWLLRPSDCDGRNFRGRFSYRKFIVGNELREIMGLSTEKTVDNLSTATKMSDGVYVNEKKAFLKEASLKEKKNGLPGDLVEMQESLGLIKNGVCALMNLAKRHGKWLQDVWALKKKSILNAGVTGYRAFAYVKSLILARDVFKRGPNTQSATRAKKDGRQYWHKRFFDKDGLLVKIFDGTAEIYRGSVYISYVCQSDMSPIYEAIKTGRLQERIQ